MGLENQVCYNGGAHGIKYKQSRFPLIGANAPPPPTAGGNLKFFYFFCIWFSNARIRGLNYHLGLGFRWSLSEALTKRLVLLLKQKET